ncbi:MAG TPA: hypothetical protein PLQ76_07310, partial [bacterium]|nr:hypothetical protein [bacterium]
MRKGIIILFSIFASVSFFVIQALAEEQPKLVVYYDEGYPVSWMTKSCSQEVKEFTSVLGFESLDAKQLGGWMETAAEKGAAGTMLIMSMDVVPDTVVGEAPSPTALIRKYLDAGGTIIWMGDVPFYFVGKKGRDKTKWDYLGGRGVLGFDTVGNWQGHSDVKFDKKGIDWKLKKTWQSIRAVKPQDVTSAVALDADGNVSAWTKQYEKSSPGFIRIWDFSFKSFTDDMGQDLYRVIANNSPDFKVAKKYGSIYLFQPSDYWPLIHRDGDRLMREVQVSVFDNAPGKKTYKLKISQNKVPLNSILLFDDERAFYKRNILVPVFYPNQTLSLTLESGGASKTVSETSMNEEEYFFETKWSRRPERNPIDLGTFLIPQERMVIGADQTVKLDVAGMVPGDGPSRQVQLELKITDREKNVISDVVQNIEMIPGKFKEVSLETAAGKLLVGKYLAALTAAERGRTVFEDVKWIIVKKAAAPQKDFGAYEARIDYEGSVMQYDREKKSWSSRKWDDVWARGPKKDVVVAFPNGNRFVFWRGSGYVPFWASPDNVGLTYEWIEASFERNGLVDCIEVLQDKECRYSRVQIVESTPARVVVRWRYAIADLEYSIVDNEWGEETYTFYPDGFGVRAAVGHIVPMTWHEA